MKPKIREVIVVEGRYDHNTLAQVVDATVVELGGFAVFHDAEKLALLRRLAETRGLIPDIAGKERRKRRPGKEGKLGVEGMDPATLLSALRRCGATFEAEGAELTAKEPITKADLFALGLSGGSGSAERRKALTKALDLPEYLSPNALLDVLNLLTTREELAETVRHLAGEIGE